MASQSSAQLSASDLLALLPSTRATSVPSDDTVTNFLANRFRADLPYSSLASSTLVCVNPLEVLPDVSDASARIYAERYNGIATSPSNAPLQPHPFETAGRLWQNLRALKKHQAVVYTGFAGSGKTHTSGLITSQLVRLSPGSSKRAAKLPDQLKALDAVLFSFGTAKISSNPSASRVSRLLELHFSPINDMNQVSCDPQLKTAKLLTFGLEKSRVTNIKRDERSYNVFYQLLSGSTPLERSDYLLLDDAADYRVLAKGQTKLPNGPRANDAIAFDDLRASLQILGIKPKMIPSLLSVLSAILLLGNITFGSNQSVTDPDLKPSSSEGAWVDAETHVYLERAATLLKVSPEELEQRLLNRTRYVKKELCTVLLDASAAAKQRDSFAQSLYSILFAFVIESSNAKLFSSDSSDSLVVSQLDIPGFQPHFSPSMGVRRQSTLVDASDAEPFSQFCIHFQSELLQHWIRRNAFDGSFGRNEILVNDGISLSTFESIDGSVPRLELLRGEVLGTKSDKKPGGIIGHLGRASTNVKKGKVEPPNDWTVPVRERYRMSSVLGKQQTENDRNKLSIRHYTSEISYDISDFVEEDGDLVDSDFVTLLRGSSDSFITRLFSGPSLAAEVHPKDNSVIVTAQVSSLPFRKPACLEHANENILLESSDIHPFMTQVNASLSGILNAIERSKTQIWPIICLRPNNTESSNRWNGEVVKSQISALGLGELIAGKRVDFVAGFTFQNLRQRYSTEGNDLGDSDGETTEKFKSIMTEQKWLEGIDLAFGKQFVWMSQRALRFFEFIHRTEQARKAHAAEQLALDQAASSSALEGTHSKELSSDSRGPFADPPKWAGDDSLPPSPQTPNAPRNDSDDLLGYASPNERQALTGAHRRDDSDGVQLSPRVVGENMGTLHDSPSDLPRNDSDYFGDYAPRAEVWDHNYESKTGLPAGASSEKILDSAEHPGQEVVEEQPQTRARRIWVFFVYFITWWIPSFMLKYLGRMKRPDIRMAWREKVAICFLIFLFCATVIFLIIGLQWAMCPGFNFAWNPKQLGYHQGEDDYWVAVRGEVYDLTNFWRGDHSDIPGRDVTRDQMLQLAGKDLTDYFPIPINVACPGLVTSTDLRMQYANFTQEVPGALHKSGPDQPNRDSALAKDNWYPDRFLPKMKKHHQGPLVYDNGYIKEGLDLQIPKQWVVYENGVYDLTNYFWTIDQNSQNDDYAYLPSEISDLVQERSGGDITSAVNDLSLSSSEKSAALSCMKNLFFVAHTDYRETVRCRFPGYLLIAFAAILVATIAGKFLAALQLSSKKVPEPRDKFVILQVPCYTEGERSLKKTIDSLANLKYDDKRKLLFVICDGMIVGSGNDRPTPRIVLDILGVDPKHDPEPLRMRSVGEGSRQLNYGKVYSGLYEHQGHVLPYVVVVKVGKPTERSQPGNRGKRDSQILLMQFLNRVHFDSGMTPHELEMFHQIKNIIGVDPHLYEYLLCVDADTEVTQDSLTRLISVAADDSRIVGLCGETKLANEQKSWWTMIQVYEYFISHHLAKAFESLFGTVTCLPGCFSLYRIRTNDQGRPLIISNLVIDDYCLGEVDTLHKKNLLQLGEDRYFTTLILKHFPRFKTKFTADAVAVTTAPDKWSVLVSQRRRWINSTIHNLVELMGLGDMCGFCCFSMRFVVMIDLVGTIMLPATTVYLVYLIVTVSTGSGQIPFFSIMMIVAVYGLQIIIFLLKRQWQFIGWLIIYLLAYPVYSFLLPIYSFWHMDDFSWGNTRIVVGEGRKRRVLAAEDDHFDESMIPMQKFSDYQAEAWDTQSRPSFESERTRSMAPSARGSQYAGSAYNPSGNGLRSRHTTMQHVPQMNPYGPQMPMMQHPQSRAGSVAGSEHSGYNYGISSPPQHTALPPFAPPVNTWGGSQMSFNADVMMGSQPAFMGEQPQQARRNSTFSAFTNYQTPAGMGMMGMQPMQRMSQSASMSSLGALGQNLNLGGNPFGVSTSVNPSADELRAGVRSYLGTQDLMTVTKRTARSGVAALFPNANLEGRETEMNRYIDEFCQGS